jgi:uncharacterized C2H2 Zn-finger protein
LTTEKREIHAPMAAWVRNGSTSGRHDKMQLAKRADAEKRRAEEDQKFALARSNPHEAKIHQKKLGSRKEHPCAVLAIKHPKDGTVNHWMVCEVTNQGEDLLLMMQCPRCIYTYKRAPDDSIMHIRSSHRKWHLDQRTKESRALNPITRTCAGELWIDPDDQSAILVAGTVTTEDWCKCPVCSWEFKIDDSVVYTR